MGKKGRGRCRRRHQKNNQRRSRRVLRGVYDGPPDGRIFVKGTKVDRGAVDFTVDADFTVEDERSAVEIMKASSGKNKTTKQ